MGVYVTYAGGAVHHECKRIHAIMPGSYASEALATNRAAERVVPFRELARAFDVAHTTPTLVLSDSAAPASVTSLHGTATKMKHMLRHIHSVMQRVLYKEIAVKHIPGDEMPADFLTKWVTKGKAEASIAYLTNSQPKT